MRRSFPINRITHGPQFHTKGYYDMQPWSADGGRFLCMESTFQDRAPTADDELTIGVVDLDTEQFGPVTTTRAWNIQQGCMLHWLDDDRIVFNDRVDNAFRAVICSVRSAKRWALPQPVQALTSDRRFGATLNFARWAYWRPGYGYQGVPDPFADKPQPEDDIVQLQDMQTGECTRLVGLRDIARLTSDHDYRRNSYMWFCHLMFNTNGSRLIGLVRWWCADMADAQCGHRRHCMWCIDTNGQNLDIIADDALVSHAEWRDPDHILYFGNSRSGDTLYYLLVNVVTKESQVIGETYLKRDGHMSYHNNKRWLLTDTYPDADDMRTIKIYDIDQDREIVLGNFYSDPRLQGEIRCDLHPCWNRDYTQVTIDSSHEGDRQVYVMDVGELA